MILKAIIENKEDQYRYRVRIPQINKTVNDPTGTPYENLYIAQVCSLPNCIPDYAKGDVVYIAFEKDSKELPVIIGQFYRDQKSDSSTEILTQEDLFKQYILTTQTSQNSLKDIISDFDSTHNISNRNFIDNSWFTINQRGKSKYNVDGYTVDRWYIGWVGIDEYLEVINSGLMFYGSPSSAFKFIQILDINPEDITGETFTLSALCLDGVHSITGKININPYQMSCNLSNNSTMYLWKSSPTTLRVVVECHDRDGLYLRAIKLEKGSTSTLANDTTPDSGEELIRCITSRVDNNDDYANKKIATKDELPRLGNLTIPTISSTVKSGSIYYIKYGKVVLVMVNAMLMKAAGNQQTIATQLPVNKSGAFCGISCLRDSNAGVYTGFLYIGNNSTELKFHAHQNSVTETTYASFVYFTE